MNLQTLTGKQKRQLRGQGQRLEVTLAVGQGGVSENFIGEVSRHLDSRELIKVRLFDERGRARQAAAERIAERTRSICVGVVGKTLLLYRPTEL
ncbi:MAG: ribosome assembly RNA-binding protein YhbY [Planctomycetota bacterium]|nr:MAG: ribosome assembly RNA-binding protein YhbY [Planctomycetota bacterium]